MRKKENTSVGRIIRERMGFTSTDRASDRESPNEKHSTKEKGYKFGQNKGSSKKHDVDFDRDEDFDTDDHHNHSLKKKKSVRIMDEKENLFGEVNHSKDYNRKDLKTANFASHKPSVESS